MLKPAKKVSNEAIKILNIVNTGCIGNYSILNFSENDERMVLRVRLNRCEEMDKNWNLGKLLVDIENCFYHIKEINTEHIWHFGIVKTTRFFFTKKITKSYHSNHKPMTIMLSLLQKIHPILRVYESFSVGIVPVPLFQSFSHFPIF